ncbi:DNA adenine methylase [Paenibacillus sp. WQ 127069]|uniref:DNA adenine methylase n=1 Tax=Paenibacillus baimaensis TaxID=2982185 RepID=A0ABT2UFA3_9BACL|nr:DNA adenine methylase [Paenibacillus sp. WQ 127069]MCU6793322.1 DNA adenine methylase [Paenibacillus sp. WQ 127069]
MDIKRVDINRSISISPLRYFGGKSFLAKEIKRYIPQSFRCWVDVCGGGGHMTTAMDIVPRRVEVFNDIDGELINFLLTLRSRKTDLIGALATLPTSRLLYESWLGQEIPEDRFERAVRYFYMLRQCLIPSPNSKSGFRYSKVKYSAFDYQNAVKRLDIFETRFRNVLIECLDYSEIIKRYDSTMTFFFCDAPYLGREHMYQGGFSWEDHVKLAKMLQSIEGKCIVTYYGDPEILELYQGWHYVTTKAKVGTVKKGALGQSRREETEFFFMNYIPDETGQQINLF